MAKGFAQVFIHISAEAWGGPPTPQGNFCDTLRGKRLSGVGGRKEAGKEEAFDEVADKDTKTIVTLVAPV